MEHLLEFRLLKFDNGRNLPLKSGGKTDVYINLRDARDNPEAISYLAELFAWPVTQLGVERFVEVPDSVSCFAGPLAIETRIPYLTIRDEAKEGRVGNARVIGHANPGDSVCIIDDVITDGASKIGPFIQCHTKMNLAVQALVVLVDRQQGWQQQETIKGVNVWAGMTLHDVRRELIAMGEMRRCEEVIEEKNPIIVALDGKSWDEILPLIDQLRTTGCILKVNDFVFAEGMDHLLPELSVYGRVMVDLKCHDIPNPVENACKRLAKHNVWAVTAHASGGGEMVKVAVKALAGTNTKVLAITALTSLDDEECKKIYGKTSAEAVRGLAFLAHTGGAHGFVCSPQEVSDLKAQFPENKLFVTPGVRSDNKAINDQARIATPKGAINNGSHHLVMGRQILGAKDPVAEVKRVLTEEIGITM